jgi:hypothetical protein
VGGHGRSAQETKPPLIKRTYLNQPMKKHVLSVERLFLVISIYSGVVGIIGLLTPHLLQYFLFPHGEKLSFRDNNNPSDLEPHFLVRLYGSTHIAFSYITFSARRLDDAIFRKDLVRAFSVLYILLTLSLLRAQLARDSILSAWNWLNILLYGFIASVATKFGFFEPVKSFTLPNQWH